MGGARRFGRAAVLLVASLCTGCGSSRPAAENQLPAAPASLAAQRGLGTPLDLGAVTRQVRFAFRPDGARFSSGQDIYAVSAAPDGGFELVGFHHPDRSPSPTTSSAPQRRLPSPSVLEGRPLAVRTVAITGLPAAAIRPAKMTVATDGRLTMERGPLHESLRASEQGLEQSWHVAERPAGTQALVIHVRLSGLPFVGQTPTGLHFADAVSGVGVRFGNATWVDADGRRTAVALDFAGGELRLAVPRAVLDASRFPAVLDPFLSPEFGMDNPTQGPSLGGYAAAGAFDGTNYLVVWEDSRQGSRRIYGTRVNAAGVVLDPQGIVVGNTTEQGKPAVAYGGGNFLVVWLQSPSGSTPKVTANRVARDGTVLDAAGMAVSGAPFGGELDPKVAFDGTNFMVVWSANGTGGLISAERISPAGARLDATPITVSRLTSQFGEAQGTPNIAFDGTNYMVVWQDDRGVWWDVYANRVTPAGVVLDGTGFPVATADAGENQPVIAFDGTNYLVAWSSWPDRSATNRDSSIFGRRVSPAGTVLDATALAIAVAPGEQGDPTLAFAGGSFLVAWGDYRGGGDPQIFSTRVGKDGAVLDPQGRLLAGATVLGYKSTLVAGAGQFLLAWSSTDIRGALLGADGSGQVGTGQGFALSSAPNTQQDPAVAFDGTNYFVVWADSRTGGPSIYGTRVSRQGAVLDLMGIRISPSAGVQGHPVIAWNGTHYLVVWFAYNQMKARRVAPDGSLPDAADISFPVSFPLTADVASNGSDFLVVGSPSPVYDVEAYRVSGAGVVLDQAAISVAAATAGLRDARVAFDGTNYFVIWTDGRFGAHRTFAGRVSGAGTVLDPAGILLGTATGKEYHMAAHVASGGGSSFVVWRDLFTHVLAGSRVSAAGAVLDPPEIALLTSPTTDVVDEPRITFDGTTFVVTWVDANYTGTTLVSNTLYVAPLGPNGTADSALAVTTNPKDARLPALASDRAGGTLIAYVVPGTTSGFPVARVRARIFSETAPAGSCASASECASGFCVDAVCCNSACGGGATNDCQACSVLAGAAVSGTCGPVGNGRACDDGNVCTRSDTCAAGACVGASPVVCLAQDSCHAPGACAPTTGLCSNPPLPNGTVCAGGTCQTGTCRPGPGGGGTDGGGADGGGADDAAGGSGADVASPTDDAGAADTTTGSGADARAADAATGDAAADRGPKPSPAGCGCRLTDAAGPRATTLLLLMLAVCLARRQRKTD